MAPWSSRKAIRSLYADEVEVFEGQDRVLARGNVVLIQGNNRIAADHAEFNTKTHLGTFYAASGMATVQPPRQIPQPGAIAVPQVPGQPTDVVFFGEVIEKVGNKKYKITNGGFSACEQPTPRWDLNAGTVILNVDHYTILRQAIFRVKGVPMLYTPIMYFPTKEDGRATGFLIPTYGVSRLRGQTIHNAFFWAMSRWQDATFLYDWFSKTGTGGGGEYRFNRGGGTDGQLSVYRLDERTTTYDTSTGSQHDSAARRASPINSNAEHVFPFRLRGRARVNYFSSITANQTFQTNVNIAAVNNRYYGGNLVGGWGSYSLNAQYDHTENFPDDDAVLRLWRLSQHLIDPRRTAAVLQELAVLFLGDRRLRAPGSFVKAGRRGGRRPLARPRRFCFQRSAIRSRNGSGLPSIRPSAGAKRTTRGVSIRSPTCRSTTV